MSTNSASLNFELNSDFVQTTISDVLIDHSVTVDVSKKLEKLNEYINQLENELRKIQVFERVLPLSALLVTEIIAKLKEMKMQCLASNSKGDAGVYVLIESSKNKNWLSSAQIWSHGDEDKSSDHIKNLPMDSIKERIYVFVQPESGLNLLEKEFLTESGVSDEPNSVTNLELSLGSEPSSKQRCFHKKNRRDWTEKFLKYSAENKNALVRELALQTQQSTSSSNPTHVDEPTVFEKVLGPRRGHIKGIGRKPPGRATSSSYSQESHTSRPTQPDVNWDEVFDNPVFRGKMIEMLQSLQSGTNNPEDDEDNHSEDEE